MKLRRLVLGVLVSAAVLVAPAAAIAKPHPRSVRVSATLTLTEDFAAGSSIAVGSEIFSPGGKASTRVVLDATAPPPIVKGREVAVFANGDKLFMDVSGTITEPDSIAVGVTFTSVLVTTITGGTGRFAGASGSVTLTGQSVITSVTETTLVTFDTFSGSGTISYRERSHGRAALV